MLDGTQYRYTTIWTETWANDLSNNYFGGNSFSYPNRFPNESLSSFNLMKFIMFRTKSPRFFIGVSGQAQIVPPLFRK